MRCSSGKHDYVRRTLYYEGSNIGRPAPDSDGCGFVVYADINASAIDGSRRCGYPPAGEECADAQLPDGPTCPACGGERLPSGIDGGSWVHAVSRRAAR